MSITDELREYARSFKNSYDAWSGVGEHLDAIADRIDAEHEAKVSYWQDASYKDGYDEGFASADDWLGQHEDAMAEHGWVRLPVDADGEYIHIGDLMAYADNTKPMEVVALVPPAVFLTEDGPRYANMCRHYHEPTVEDVLTEFGIDWEHESDCEDRAALLKEYAAKLRLAGDGE